MNRPMHILQAISKIQFMLLLGALSIVPLDLGAQVNEEMKIVTPYKPKLTEANKIDIQPLNKSIQVDKPELTYSNEAAYMALQPSKNQLPAVSLGEQRLDPLRNTFLKAGLGNYSNILGEFNYNTLRNESQALSAYAKHNSGNGPVSNSDFSEQIVNIGAKHLYDNSTLEGELYFKNNIYHAYGYNQDRFDPDQDSLKARYTRYGFETSFDNERGDTGNIRYWINAGAHNLGTNQNTGETDLFASGKVRQHFQSNAAEFKAKYRYLDYRSGDNAYGRSIFKVNGHYILNHDIGQAKIGFRTASVSDTGQSPFHFYPYLKLSIPILEDGLTAFGGIQGDLDVNTYQDFVNENPYARSNLPLKNTNNQFEIFAGLKGNIQQKASYNARLTYKNVENLPFYVNDSTVTRRFGIRYNDGVAAIFGIKGEFRYTINDKWHAYAEGEFRNFNLTEAESPWHIPTLTYKIGGEYKIQDKVRLHANIFGFNQRDYLAYDDKGDPEAKELDGVLDLNAGINYRFSKAFSAFFNFKNILGNEYQYWNQYPVRGFHVNGGIKVNLY